jgi:hypothetical protein
MSKENPMTTNRLAELQDRLATTGPSDLSAVALDGLTLAWPPTEVSQAFDPDLTSSFDKALALIGQALPGWGVGLDGTAAAGGTWTCKLRATGLRDDDELIGIGTAATAPLALIVALLQVLISRSKGYS